MVFAYALFLLLPEDGVAAFKFFNSVCKSILLSREFQMSFCFTFSSPSRQLSIVVYYSNFFVKFIHTLWKHWILVLAMVMWCSPPRRRFPGSPLVRPVHAQIRRNQYDHLRPHPPL